jgi:outer membrane receptor protein involved in Fe transport
MRFDNWKTEGIPGNGFPLSTEFAALNAAIPGLQAAPGALGSLVTALPGLVALAGGTGASRSDRNSKTYNFGIVGRFPLGVNPYFRWANSYREPGITERYLIRNFTPGVPGLASLVVGNPNLTPEKGENYDVGVKVTQRRFTFSAGYFHNKITDLLAFAPAQTYCVAPLPGLPGGFAGGCPAVGGVAQVGVQVNARVNFASVVIKGWESTGEASIPLGSLGSLNPFYSAGWLHGTNNNQTTLQIAQFNTIYNRSDTPLKLRGSLTDFPLGSITPFRTLFGAQYLESKGRFFVEYSGRHQARVERADPGQFVGTALINYGSFQSVNPFTKHTIKGGYNWKTEKYKFSFNVGVDNIADKLFWEHFQNAPAPGRSLVFGITTEIFNFIK